MPVNTRGGNKTKKQKRNWGKDPFVQINGEQMYGRIEQNNGNHWVVLCADNIKRQAPVKGGPRLFKDSFVIISLRMDETNQKKCDIIGPTKPPNNILEMFKRFDPTKKSTLDIDFKDSDDEIEVKKKSNTNSNTNSYIVDIDYPTRDDDDEYEYVDVDQVENLENLENLENIENIENKRINNREEKEVKEVKEVKSNTKLSSSKQKLIAKFMDSSDDEDEDDVDLDGL